ncbi:hypothetical protein [Paracoccus seriniphilus]|uniref:Major tropism determinant N-terminal domain-containing protein n=1 Tax=Paracoccus seriniphilus TaxID=184748 RepID=A0A239Q3C8_9RHOB|nr:hypothetical protein [Paracoccus seriniphilus]WCR13209.1 hypothetical protein JHW44_09675 [Paracoccus seriniphilus]SNT76702.1 hypothetical protein SAMN05444959_1259 [Paracoccus seriniphilus]
MPSIQHKRGLKANLPSSALLAGEIHLTTDRQTAHFPTDADTMVPIVPAIGDLTAMGAVDGAADFLMLHDSSAAGVQARRITVDAFRTALNIPSGSSDELVAVTSGGTSGYLWGTDGTDGIIRMNSSMSWSKDPGNGFVTLAVGAVDCGEF